MKKSVLTYIAISAVVLLLLPLSIKAQDEDASLENIMKALKRLERHNESLRHRLDVIEKQIDDVSWFVRLSDRIVVQKVRHYGPPRWRERNPTAQGAGNPLKFYSYVFYSRDLDPNKKYPLLLFP
ncbi:MAG: hypothetical protein MI919_09130, partial [Holophagales bacterium]|nr:hypothetical protein [Holophagales bacterium]